MTYIAKTLVNPYLCVDEGEFPEGKPGSLFFLVARHLKDAKVDSFVESWPITVTLDSVYGNGGVWLGYVRDKRRQ